MYNDLDSVMSSEALCGRYFRSCNAGARIENSEGRISINADILDSCFLTVIIRTQGNRIEPLREVLLCLCAQSCQDFVVYLMCHKVDDDTFTRLHSIIDSLPVFFKDRVALFSVDCGGRSHPLNVALENLQTDYFVALDDDDLVFDNWVDSFRESISNRPGTIAHCGVFTQEWVIRENVDSVTMSANGSPVPRYCRRFDAVEQLIENQCPIMSLAFPSYLPKVFGQYFDEDLSTLEDWDYLMRSARICGVTETDTNTAIYRLWSTPGFNSHAIHSPAEWEKNRLYVLDKLNSMPVLLPEMSVKSLGSERLWLNQPMPLSHSDSKIEYLDKEWNVVSESSIRSQYNPETLKNTLELGVSVSSVKRIRLFAYGNGLYSLREITATVVFDDDAESSFSTLDFNSNGYLINTTYSMLRHDSWLEICLDEEVDISKVVFEFEYIPYVNEDLLSGTKLMVRLKAKARKILYRNFGFMLR